MHHYPKKDNIIIKVILINALHSPSLLPLGKLGKNAALHQSKEVVYP
jgi:hypothetical protein